MTTYNVSIDSLNQQIRSALDRFDLDEVRQLLVRALPQADADTLFLAAHVATNDAEQRMLLEQALQRNPQHWMAQLELERRYGVPRVASTAPASDALAEQQGNATTIAQREQERQAKVAALQQRAMASAQTTTAEQIQQRDANIAAQRDKVLQAQRAAQQKLATRQQAANNEVPLLERPLVAFVVCGVSAAVLSFLILSINMPRASGAEYLVTFLACMIAGVASGFFNGVLAQARIALLPLLLGLLPSAWFFGLFNSLRYGNGGMALYPLGIGLLVSVVVAYGISKHSKAIEEAGGHLGKLPKGLHNPIIYAAVTSAVMLFLVQLPNLRFFSFGNLLMKIAFVSAVYAAIAWFSVRTMRSEWWRRPTLSFPLLLLSGCGAILLFMGSIAFVSSFFQDSVFINFSWAPWMFSGVLNYIVMMYLLATWSSWKRKVNPPTPEQQAQANAVAGAIGIAALALGAAYLKGAPERAKRRQAELAAQQRQQQQAYEQAQRQQQAQQQQIRAQQQARVQQSQAQQARDQQARDQQAREQIRQEQAKREREQREFEDRMRQMEIDAERENRKQQNREHERFLKEHRGPYDP
jgi:hypothetical protein